MDLVLEKIEGFKKFDSVLVLQDIEDLPKVLSVGIISDISDNTMIVSVDSSNFVSIMPVYLVKTSAMIKTEPQDK